MKISFVLLLGFVWLSYSFPLNTLSAKKQKVIDHAKWQTTQDVTYDGSYRKIDYPNGDVPADVGVCTDVIIRAYRAIDVDLQVLIHEDMVKNRAAYQKRKKTKVLDTNIDHRRCPNMITFFERQGARQPITKNGADYLPGDIVFWDVAAGHVGIVVDDKVKGTNRYQVVHNIGLGPMQNDFLFQAKIVDHFRWGLD
ncbi:MAG: DUF1287 domain-containing protein [Crocinitomicaceae bacterium]|nr:DUF1287 domain-containing protein [Crocinitomicaceae bacterium]